MSTEKTLDGLVLNRVKSQEIFNSMIAQGLIKEDELYFIEGAQASFEHPTYTAHEKALYKVSVDALGHVNDVTLVTKDDIVALGIPGQDTNTDTMVTQSATSSNEDYPLLLSISTEEGTRTAVFDSGVTLNPSTNIISANISGNAATSTKATQDASGNVITTTYAKQTDLNAVEIVLSEI